MRASVTEKGYFPFLEREQIEHQSSFLPAVPSDDDGLGGAIDCGGVGCGVGAIVSGGDVVVLVVASVGDEIES